MSVTKYFKQLQPETSYYRTIVNTMWLYPQEDIDIALASTSYKYTFDGTIIICPDMENFIGLYTDIYDQTAISQPIGNQGFSLGVGTFLQNFGKTIYWQVPAGNLVLKWQLVKQLTPQTTDYIPVPGNSPNDTVGYIVTYNPQGPNQFIEANYVVLDG